MREYDDARKFDARKFDSNVQIIKNRVLTEVAKRLWCGEDIFRSFDSISAKVILPDEPSTSCCIYKDRAKLAERIRVALGGNDDVSGIIEIIGLICDECPEAGHTVTDLCRGCLAHSCQAACRLGAISYENNHAVIDKSKCVECGQCAKACPYSAITNFKRPCEKACKANAISMGPGGEAVINYSKCTSCGVCMIRCPFGAPIDKSYISEVIDIIKGSRDNEEYPVISVVAPAIASQFSPIETGRVITAIRKLGFKEVYEAALGADVTAYKESAELEEKGRLISSCCPAFVEYIEKKYPALVPAVSHNLSPMAEISRIIKTERPDARIVFIGPCTAKKAEIKRDRVSPYVDSVITFEELLALLDSREIDLELQEIGEMDQATGYGRKFAHSGGVSGAVVRALEERGSTFEVNAICVSGFDKIKPVLSKAAKEQLEQNFIEGMACQGGCTGGAGCLKHTPRQDAEIDKHASEAGHDEISERYNSVKSLC